MKTVGIIQARMGSTRLPGKMTMDLCGKPVIAHVIERAKAARALDEVYLATTTSPQDDILADWATAHAVPSFRGSEEDVLDRYYQTALQAHADVVVRLTGDCPLLDPAVIDTVVSAHKEGGAEYTSNIHPPTFPDGLDTEVFSFAALEKAWKEATLQSEREHVTPYIWKHPEFFKMSNVKCQMSNADIDLSAERWTLDTPEDLAFLRTVCANLPPDDFTFATALRVINQHPEWRGINAMHARNEGYAKSVSKDALPDANHQSG